MSKISTFNLITARNKWRDRRDARQVKADSYKGKSKRLQIKWNRRAKDAQRVMDKINKELSRRWKVKLKKLESKQYPNDTHYSKNFTRKELNCKGPECAGKQPSWLIQKRLSKLAKTGLEPLRLRRIKRGEKSVGILSGYRCKIHNARVNGATNSRHMKGDAADVIPTGTQSSWVEDMKSIRAFYNGGIGAYPNGGVHGDVRGWIARWTSF